MASKAASFSIKPVVSADFPALAEVAGAAMDGDRHTQLKAAHPTKPYNHAGGMAGAFEYWSSLPKNRVDFVKAVDTATDQVLGFVCWGLRLEEAPPTKSKAEKPSVTVSEDYQKTEDPTLDPLARLEELTSSHLANYQKKVMPPGTRCMIVITIAVHPKHQGHGVGTALLQHGTDRADAEGVFCWVHTSEAGASTFRKCGFEVDKILEIDLDQPAGKMDIKPSTGQDKWGKYSFAYMVRQPRTG